MARCEESNCGYYWKEEGEDYPRCHYPDNDPFPAPCEYEDEINSEEENFFPVYPCDLHGICPYPFKRCDTCSPIDYL